VTIPGPILERGTVRASRSFPTQTDTMFVTGESEKGKSGTVIELRSMAQVIDKLGDRLAANPSAYDGIELFFAEGGSRVLFSREVGPSALRASVVLDDASAADTMKVWAKGEGSYGNSLNVQIVAGTAGGTFVVVITHDTLGELERSYDLADVTAAVLWSETTSKHVTITDDATSALDPAVVSATSLSGGTDDRASITQTHVTAALAVFTAEYGPGQVVSGGRTTDEAHSAIITHCAAHNRVARLDGEDTATAATIATTAAAGRTVAGHESARMFAPWIKVRGLTSTTTRLVAPSFAAAACEARNDTAGISPNQAAAGETGILQSSLVLGLSQDPYSEANRETLADAGVTVIRRIADGSLRIYDLVTLADQLADAGASQAGTGRFAMALDARFAPIAEQHQFREITAANLLSLAAGVEGVIKSYGASVETYTVAPADIEECWAAEELIVNADLEVVVGARVVRITTTIATKGTAS
jgi:hypothetical protein